MGMQLTLEKEVILVILGHGSVGAASGVLEQNSTK
jgi:hypothetical protein